MKPPEEKAKELVEMFHRIIPRQFGGSQFFEFDQDYHWEVCKEAAIACVDETLKNGCTLPSSAGYYGDNEEASKYNLKVKEEIKKL